MSDKNDQVNRHSDADMFDDAGRRDFLKKISKVGVAAVPTAIVLSSATKAQASSTGGGASSTPGGGFGGLGG
ncbi:hypothetical protein ACS3SW_20190 [Roseobacteraceae bacterium S113]